MGKISEIFFGVCVCQDQYLDFVTTFYHDVSKTCVLYCVVCTLN